MALNHVPIRVENDSIVVQGEVDGKPVEFILDTGDAIGPVFTQADADRLGLTPTGQLGVEGAGGASTAYTTVASVTLGRDTWTDEPSAIDAELQGLSLIGLPFFLKECRELAFSFTGGFLVMVG